MGAVQQKQSMNAAAEQEVEQAMHAMGARARAAFDTLSTASAEQKTAALTAIAAAIRAAEPAILAANAMDYEAAKAKGLASAMLDRLQLTPQRISAMAEGVAQVAAQPDPIGRVLEAWDNPSNGLHFTKVAVPLGVIGIIYESRPNVTADAVAMCLKSGNACILRGGSESAHSAQAIMAAVHQGLRVAGLPEDAAQLVATTDRAAVGVLLRMRGVLDVMIPRGGASLTRRVAEESLVPTILHLTGNCHSYIHTGADAAKAVRIVHNAKLRRTGICGALESLLFDAAIVGSIGAAMVRDLLDAGCEVRGDTAVQALDPRVKAASAEDWDTEYLDTIISAKTVRDVAEAVAHINAHGSHHTDAIITEDAAAAQYFTGHVDSAIVLVNASTQFADGGEFGFGGEIGIATGRLHARGPVAAAQLTTYKYIVTTSDPAGAIRAG